MNAEVEKKMEPSAIEIEELTKTFGGVHAVEKVTLKVPVGQRRVLIGPNGAGKTTLFNCITGSLPPTSGRIFLFGKEVTHLAEHRRTAMGLGRTYQITNVFQDLTVLENIILSMQGTSRKKWVFHRSVKSFPEILDQAAAETVGTCPGFGIPTPGSLPGRTLFRAFAKRTPANFQYHCPAPAGDYHRLHRA
jgi:ABC-type branched-subunit amino acid transport system ATPase component